MASKVDATATDNKASIALLRRLRAGGEHDVDYVHRIDVCAAPPEVLVADLEPVPGTAGLDDDGYSRKWYFYHAKKYKNTRGDTSGYRQREVTDGGGARWHSEIGRKNVLGSGGGTFCTLCYGIKTGPSAPLDRLGWCMVEYDIVVAGDKKQDEAAVDDDDDSSNYVLCKVYRSPRAKGKPASASSSSKKQTAKKRKPGGGDHPEAPPAKSIQQQQQEHQETAYCHRQPEDVQKVAVQQPTGPDAGADFDFNIEDINFFLDESMLQDEPEPEPEPEPEHGLQQPIIAEPETVVQPQSSAEPEEFTVDWFLQGQSKQPIVEPPPGHGGGEFIQMPCGMVVSEEATVEDMLGPETMYGYGQWSGGMTTTASIPWSSYAYDAPTSSSYTACSGRVQGSDPILRFPPYLMC